MQAADKSIPNKIVTIKPSDHPWITCHIKNMIRKRKRTFRQFKKTNINHYWLKYKTIRNNVVKEIRQSKQQYFDKLDQLLSSENIDSKLFWKTSKQLLNLNKSSGSIPTLKLNSNIAENDKQKAELLNHYFTSQTMVDDANKELPHIDPSNHTLDSIVISCQDVKDVLLHLNVTKASGPDLISPRLLREGADILALPYSVIFNRSLDQGYFPSSWKEANVTPIYKKDDKSLPSNYRPISLLSQSAKVMERCVHKYLYNYVISNHILTPLQSGFVHGDSTTYQLLHTYHQFCEAVDNGKEVRAVFCDISKAFDRVWHKGLLHKLRGIGCSEKILLWFSSYLSDRRQRVVLNGIFSDWMAVFAGVPQGSILGPLLFLIFINDIVKCIGASIRLFADDTSLYIIVDLPDQAATILNTDLKTISDWANSWLVAFNASKTLSVIFSRKSNPVVHPSLFMHDTMINETTNHKHLGLILSNNCSWTEHINSISDKAWARLNLMRTLKFRVSRTSLEKMYISYVRPLIEYSNSVWDNCSTESKNQLESIHIEAARVITGATKLCSIEKLFADLGWESLQKRRNKHKLVIFYKILHGIAPTYLSDIVPPLIQDTTTYNLRNAGNIQNYRVHTNLFSNSFFPSTVRAWNDLPNDIKNAPSVGSFKYKINKNPRSPPKFYNAGTRKGQILQARLRMECSSLNSDLHRKNIVPSPFCRCGVFESRNHFFFTCPLYSLDRLRYLPDNLDDFTSNDLLFGCENQSDEFNESLFLKVQEFLIRSGRFG